MSNRRDFLKQAGFLGTAAFLSHATHRFNLTQSAQGAELDPMTSYTVPMNRIVRDVPPKRVITIPNVEGFQVLKGDFHMHTIFSDGSVWPQQRVVEAVGNGLDIISITDHIEYRPHVGGNGLKLKDRNDDHNIAYEYAKDTANKQGLLLARGTEITKSIMPPGHFNALFVQDVNPIAAVQGDIRKMFEEVIKQGGFLLWNHPGWQAPKSGGIEPGALITFTDTHEEFYKNGWLHGVEAFNGTEFYPVVSNWCESRELAIFANSDIHPPEFEQYGVRNPRRPITLVLAKEKTLDSAKEAFFAKRTIGWAGDMIFGRECWVRPLFQSCVEIRRDGNKLVLVNKSSIPVQILYGNQTPLLGPLGTVDLILQAGVDTMLASNWFVGMNKSLEVAMEF